MVKCDKCGNSNYYLIKIKSSDGKKIFVCTTCYDKIEEDKKKKELEEYFANAPKIQCPFCKKWFKKPPMEKYRTSAEINVLKWALVPAWGLAGSLKNKPFIECPLCKMKIMQG